MTEKEIGCDNCYYSYFDEKAYPCSLCIRGIERTDKWQPNKKTKADRKTESFDKDINVRSKTEPSFTATDFGKGTITRYKDEPQTDCEMPYKDCEDCETHLKAQAQNRKTEPQMTFAHTEKERASDDTKGV